MRVTNQHLQAIAFASASALLLGACDLDDPESFEEEAAALITYELVPGQYPTQEGSATICEVREASVGELTDRRVEYYHFDRMNAELAEDAQWQEFSGFESIDSCDAAREYSALRLAFEDETLEAPSETPSLYPAEEDLASTDSVEKVGEPDGFGDVDAVVQIAASSVSQNSSCSGTLIHPRVVLTAAHCIVNGGWRNVKLTREENGVVQPQVTQWARTYAHANYSGVGDPGDDVGLVIFSSPISGVDEGYDTMRVMTSSVNVPDAVTFYGWGYLTHQGTGFGVQRLGHANINWASFQHIVDNVFQGGARICKGDSGGPATLSLAQNNLSHQMVGGIASEFQIGSANCPYPGGYQRWAAPGHKISWIEDRLLDHGIDFTGGGNTTACTRFSQSGRNYMRCW